MFCPNCGSKIENDAKVCASCGSLIEIEETTNAYGAGQQQAPYGQQQAPNGGQQAPYGQQQAPNGGQQAPYGGQQAPNGGQQAPYGGQQQAPYGGQPQYTQAPYVQAPYGHQAPVCQLNTNKGLLKTILLNIITLGIYQLVVMSAISTEINITTSRYDGKKTMHFCLMFFVISIITFGIGVFVWYHKLSGRIGSELRRRGIPYSFDAADFWLWNILGSLIIIGPLVYMHKLFKSVNYINAHYNMYG